MQLDPDQLRARVEPLFRENFDRFGELGASVSIWQHGRSVLELNGGFRDIHRETPWTADTLVLIWSATKGIGSATLLHVLQQHGIALTRTVAEFWPEFGKNEKQSITLEQLMSHQAGLVALDRTVDVENYDEVIAALEEQKPLWPPGTAHGYHARTFGFLIDELTRRIAGQRLHQYWKNRIAEPLDLDVWIGLPPSESDRVATIYAARLTNKSPEPQTFHRDLAAPGTLARRVFASPSGLHAVSAMNRPEVRAQPIVSFGGIATARALAKFYSLLARDSEGSSELYARETVSLMTHTLTDGVDRVFGIPTAFSAGFMKDSKLADRRIFGPSDMAFGHPGAGGSHAFADPKNGIGFAYVMNQMEQSLLPNDKSLRLVDAIYN